MTTQEQYVARLSGMVEKKFGRRITTMEDCEALGDAVAEATKIKLDSRAYAPLFVETSRGIAPRPVTLSTLTRYLGYSSWGDFCNTTVPMPNDKSDILSAPRRWGVVILTMLAIGVVVAAVLILVLSSNGRRGVEVDDPAVVEVVDEVSERWMARTIERCNAVRAYNEAADYAARVDAFVAEYDALLMAEVKRDLESAAKHSDVDVAPSTLVHHADAIAERCKAMCRALYAEM